MKAFRPSRIVVACLLLLQVQSVVGDADDPIYAYIFGDSTMSFFDLPRQFQSCYHRATLNKIGINQHTPSGATFNTHVNFMMTDEGAPNFSDLPYRWMVLQEHGDIPALPTWHSNSIVAAQSLHSYAEQAGGLRTMFMTTWGRKTGFNDGSVNYPDFLSHNKAIFEGYLRYVEVTSAPFNPTFIAPVGLVFERIYNDCLTANIDPLSSDCLFSRLYAGDNYPSMEGTYLAALTLATAMTGYDPARQRWLPDYDGYEFDPVDADMIRIAVGRTVRQTFLSGLIEYPWHEVWQTDEPSAAPSYPPTELPSHPPSDYPSLVPSPTPSMIPSDEPSQVPSLPPSDFPSTVPSTYPSQSPSLAPTDRPSTSPSSNPTWDPTKSPSLLPSVSPTASPSLAPSHPPSGSPSNRPSSVPSKPPTLSPTVSPAPTDQPSFSPSQRPSFWIAVIEEQIMEAATKQPLPLETDSESSSTDSDNSLDESDTEKGSEDCNETHSGIQEQSNGWSYKSAITISVLFSVVTSCVLMLQG